MVSEAKVNREWTNSIVSGFTKVIGGVVVVLAASGSIALINMHTRLAVMETKIELILQALNHMQP